MQEYAANGARLGWLIDPRSKRVWAYTADGLRVFDEPESLSGDPLLPGFILDLTEIFW